MRDTGDLWRRLEAFTIGDPSAELSFARRLARENAWDLAFAGRVIAEYKRFIYLAMEAGHPVTPSDEVDQAWHLHLLYTESYWHDLCRDVLGRALHHGPTRGGEAEGVRYEENYRRTLASYEKWFGEKPPADIWPPAHVRFGESTGQVRVNTAQHWIINKRAARKTAAIGAFTFLSLAGLGAAAPLAAGGIIELVSMILFVLVIVLFVVAITAMVRRGGRGHGSGCSGGFTCGSGCGSGRGDSSGCASSGCGGGGCGGGGCGGGCGGD